MLGAPNNLRITWQFFAATMYSEQRFLESNGRMLTVDQPFLDHFNVRVSEVCRTVLPCLLANFTCRGLGYMHRPLDLLCHMLISLTKRTRVRTCSSSTSAMRIAGSTRCVSMFHS